MTVLSVIGHLLLMILNIVIALLICLVVLPIVYRVRAVKPEEGPVNVKGFVRWLFGFILFSFEYREKEFDWHLRIIGIPISDILRKRRRKKEEAAVFEGPVRAKKQPTIKPGQRSFEGEKVPGGTKGRAGPEKKKIRAEEKPGFFEKIGLTIKSIYDKIITLKQGLHVMKQAWPLLMKLLKHIRPRHIEGEAVFGLDDPSGTGMLLAVISVLYPVLPEKLELYPDFQEKRFSCDLTARGHLFFVYVLVNLIKLFRIREVRVLLNKITSGRRK